jgi:hypothetical protein
MRSYTCMVCHEPISGRTPAVIRLRVGGTERMKWGRRFVPGEFSDGTAFHWAHPECLQLIDPAELTFGACSCCEQEFEDEDSVVFVEEGPLATPPGPYPATPVFEGMAGGFIHALCAEEDLFPLPEDE